MSATAVLLAVLLAWLGIGVIASLAMGRRGHAPFTWGALGAALGPLVVPLALASVRREELATAVLQPGVPAEGPVDVLVGVDGSAESQQALRAVLELLGSRIGRLTLATVVDFETVASATHDARHAGERDLEAAAAHIGPGLVPGLVVLSGKPAAALLRHARDEGYRLLAIGARGRGASRVAFGSVASQLARAPDVPVFVVSA